MDYAIYGIIAIILLIALWVLFSKVLKNKTPKQVKYEDDLPIDLQAFLDALGGIDNITNVDATSSKIAIGINNEQVDIVAIKSLGASGIVQSNHKITVILGKISKSVAEHIENLRNS